MYKIKCHESGCDFVAKGESADEAARKLVNHISHEHKKRFEDLTANKTKEEVEQSFKDQAVESGEQPV